MNAKLNAYIELTKPKLLRMQIVTLLFGYFVNHFGVAYSTSHLLLTIAGTVLTGGGALVLNTYIERDSDSKMERTKNRPIFNEIEPSHAAFFGIGLVVIGLTVLAQWVNIHTAFLSFLTVFLYVLVYTPLKRVHWINTYAGAIPGAMLPLGGWTAVHGQLSPEAFGLFWLLFFWQMPHFFALAWMYKEDYIKGGLKMLSGNDSDGFKTSVHNMVNLTGLVLACFWLYRTDLLNTIYLLGTMTFSGVYWMMGVNFCFNRTTEQAKKLFIASVVYLPLVLILICIDVLIYKVWLG